MEIRPDGGVYDYTARYTAGATEFIVPAPSSPTAVADECARVAVAAHEALGLRDLSRSDLIVDADGTVWFLEVNVAPGMTETSLVPLSIEAAGLDLGEVLAGLVRAASTRDARQPAGALSPRAPGPAVSEATYTAIIGRAKLAFRLLGQRIDIDGAEHIPRTGGALLALNHIGYVDFVYGGFPADKVGRRVRFMAKRELFDHRVTGPLMRACRHIPVDRADGESLVPCGPAGPGERRARRHLSRGHHLSRMEVK